MNSLEKYGCNLFQYPCSSRSKGRIATDYLKKDGHLHDQMLRSLFFEQAEHY
jgi:hypothetical protein